jgi:hypothetical protein
MPFGGDIEWIFSAAPVVEFSFPKIWPEIAIREKEFYFWIIRYEPRP